MAAARTLAMGFNRIADRFWDARNPRTRMRPLVTGRDFAARRLDGDTARRAGPGRSPPGSLGRCRWRCCPGAVLFLVGYSFTKRFTDPFAFYPGVHRRPGPAGAWVAVRGSLFTPGGSAGLAAGR